MYLYMYVCMYVCMYVYILSMRRWNILKTFESLRRRRIVFLFKNSLNFPPPFLGQKTPSVH